MVVCVVFRRCKQLENMSDVEEDDSDAESACSELNGEAESEELDECPDRFQSGHIGPGIDLVA